MSTHSTDSTATATATETETETATDIPVAAPPLPSLPTDLSAILYWYTGQARAAVGDALAVLARAETDGFWPPGASRRVPAVLQKQARAMKFARENNRERHRDGDAGLLGDIGDARGSRYHQSTIQGWHLVLAMRHGSFREAPACLALADELRPHCASDAEHRALSVARGWAENFAPVAAIVAGLDASQPRPAYAFGEVSSTVLGCIGRRMGILLASIRAPEIEWSRIQRTDAKGRLQIEWVATILWPAGTAHGRSSFASGHQCEACGHQIRNPYNWVPLVGKGRDDGPPMSLWVGRDCAATLFGCAMTGQGRLRAPTEGQSR